MVRRKSHRNRSLTSALSDDAAGQRRQVRRGVVAAPLAEFGDHVLGPVLHAGFAAIHHHITQALADQRPQSLRDRVDVAVEIGFHVLAAQLVHLVPQTGRRGRPVLRARKRIAHAQNGPLAGWDFPVEAAVLGHLRGQIHNAGTQESPRPAGTAGVGTDSYSNKRLKAALSSHRWTRPPECNTASVRVYSRKAPPGPGHVGGGRQAARHHLHTVEMRGDLGERERPHRAARGSPAGRALSPACGIRAIARGQHAAHRYAAAPAREMARALNGCANSYCNHAGPPPAGAAMVTAVFKSSSIERRGIDGAGVGGGLGV